MSTLHLANTHFEWELAGKTPPSSPIFLDLEYLPTLYATKGDGILVTEKRKCEFPTFTFDEFPPYRRLETWGYSLIAKKWAEKRGIIYEMPKFEIVKKVNSKQYSFEKSPLPGARLVEKGERVPKKYIVKSFFGTAGRGHSFIEQAKEPSVAEPFVERHLDFSTQWNIAKDHSVTYLGWTLCQTTPSGVHMSNTAGMVPSPFVEEQKAYVKPVLHEMAEMGYFGEVGIDAMVYNDQKLQPIVEINARKTMGWVCLQLQKPNQTVRLSYINRKLQITYDLGKL